MKRVLILFNSFYGPGMGHNRLLRIVRHLPRFGYEPLLVTEPCRHEPFRDCLPAERVLPVPYLDLQHLYAQLRRAGAAGRAGEGAGAGPKPVSRSIGFTTLINRWLLVPDKQSLWIGPATRACRARAGRERFDVVFGSSLPASNIVAAARVARALGRPCAVEYRDLWTGNPYHNLTPPTAFHRALHARLERAALRDIAAVSCLSSGIAERLQAVHGPALPRPPRVMYNFFDPAEFAEPPPPRPAAFTISYVGTMYLTRNPDTFFRGLRRFVEKHGLTPAQVRFRWLGYIVAIAGLQEMIRGAGVEPYIDFLGQIPHAQALRELRGSHASLIIQAPDDTIHIPGKMFEAMGARVPLLAIANPCEVTDLIDRTRAGVHGPHDAEAVAAALETLWRHAQTGQPWAYQEDAVRRFSVDGAVREVADLLDEAQAVGR